MYVQCQTCRRNYDDANCWTLCPHGPIECPFDSYCPKCDTVKERHGRCRHQLAEVGFAETTTVPLPALHDDFGYTADDLERVADPPHRPDFERERDQLEAELIDLRRAHANFLNQLRIVLGYQNWPTIKGAFLDGVAQLIAQRLKPRP